MNSVFYGVKYIANYRILQKHTPLICGIVVTNRCNLRCRHCRVVNRGGKDLTFEEIVTVANSFYNEGGRSIYLEGGEPFIWHDRQYNLEDIVEQCHEIGFLSVIIYTNGTFPIKTAADTVFVSIDGLQSTHDFIRGATYKKIMENISDSNHPSIYINYTINSYNKDELEDFCKEISKVKRISGVFFYFHTPYYGYDDLYLNPVERNEVINKLIKYEKKYKILNSHAGLETALKNDWKRPLEICRVYEKGKVYNCCRFAGDPELCQNCGYLSYAEIDQTLKLRISSIFKALRYF